MKPLKFYIKERFNPQLGTYYSLERRLTKEQIKRIENPIYGSNRLIAFDTEEECLAAFEEFQKKSVKTG